MQTRNEAPCRTYEACGDSKMVVHTVVHIVTVGPRPLDGRGDFCTLACGVGGVGMVSFG